MSGIRVEIAPGVWRDTGTLLPKQERRALRLNRRKARLIVETGKLKHRLGCLLEEQPERGAEVLARLPVRLRDMSEAGAFAYAAAPGTFEPVPLAELLAEKRQLRALVDELDT